MLGLANDEKHIKTAGLDLEDVPAKFDNYVEIFQSRNKTPFENHRDHDRVNVPQLKAQKLGGGATTTAKASSRAPSPAEAPLRGCGAHTASAATTEGPRYV